MKTFVITLICSGIIDEVHTYLDEGSANNKYQELMKEYDGRQNYDVQKNIGELYIDRDAVLMALFKSGYTLVWDDPDPIPGNDYTINTLQISDGIAVITYNDGLSEAEVFTHEISVTK